MASFLTLYHHTTTAAAKAIMRDRVMLSAAPVDLPFAFFSTHRAGRAAGPLHYGEAAVEVHLPADLATVDESFRDGEQFLKVPWPICGRATSSARTCPPAATVAQPRHRPSTCPSSHDDGEPPAGAARFRG